MRIFGQLGFYSVDLLLWEKHQRVKLLGQQHSIPGFLWGDRWTPSCSLGGCAAPDLCLQSPTPLLSLSSHSLSSDHEHLHPSTPSPRVPAMWRALSWWEEYRSKQSGQNPSLICLTACSCYSFSSDFPVIVFMYYCSLRWLYMFYYLVFVLGSLEGKLFENKNFICALPTAQNIQMMLN